MKKIKAHKNIVEIKGDEMAQVIWELIKNYLINPFLDINIHPFDLSIRARDKSDDKVTIKAAEAIKKHKIGVKCATITPDEERMREFSLKKMYPSPNATIRNYLGGTIFREPIICKNIPARINLWQKPIVIARHGFADQYKACQVNCHKNQKLEFTLSDHNAKQHTYRVHDFQDEGVAMAMFNTSSSITKFAAACFEYALERNMPVYFSTKNTVLKIYDGKFKNIFADVFKQEFEYEFKQKNLFYQHRLIDDMAALILKTKGGFIWACKNYDGDVMSDLVAQGFGSLGMMTSVLITPNKNEIETEAAHGTVTRHFRLHQAGQKTSTNPIASIFAWSRALFYLAKKEQNKQLLTFSQKLENAAIDTIENNIMTKDLALIANLKQYAETEEFIEKIASKLKSSLEI